MAEAVRGQVHRSGRPLLRYAPSDATYAIKVSGFDYTPIRVKIVSRWTAAVLDLFSRSVVGWSMSTHQLNNIFHKVANAAGIRKAVNLQPPARRR